jgi:putative oxidoreductase
MADNRVRQVEDVRGSGIYPATGPLPPSNAVVRSPAALAHPEERRGSWASEAVFDRATFFAGRVILGGYFVYNGVNHFLNRKMMAEYARSKGVAAADLAVQGSGLMILLGGLSIITGIQPRLGAGLITTFLLGVSPQMHGFWKEQEPQQQMQEMVNFTKNMALVGASLMVAAHPEPWPWRLDIRRAPGALVPVAS